MPSFISLGGALSYIVDKRRRLVGCRVQGYNLKARSDGQDFLKARSGWLRSPDKRR